MKKRQIILSTVGTVLIVGAIGAVSALDHPASSGADTSPVTSQLDQQSQELANHEARIGNTERNVTDLQDKTGTPSNSNNVEVPSGATAGTPTQTAPSPTPTSNPVVVTAYREIVIDPDTSDCEYTYSDGTTYQFHWKTTNPQGSWQTDGQGQNGHWVKTTQYSSKCDASILGIQKSS